jgi:hypothetical protein
MCPSISLRSLATLKLRLFSAAFFIAYRRGSPMFTHDIEITLCKLPVFCIAPAVSAQVRLLNRAKR